MLFVFFVNRGIFFKIEGRIENESVLTLKHIVERTKEIPVLSQIVLVSGGEEPPDDSIVSECDAGLEESNPIYLFQKIQLEKKPVETVAAPLLDVVPLQERVDSLMNLQPSYNTVQQRVRLSKDFSDHAKLQTAAIRRLVKEQHMMSQGWYVALANLDEKCERLKKSFADFKATWTVYLGERKFHEDLVSNFEEHMDLLSRIRLPEALVQSCCAPQLMLESSVAATQVSFLQELHRSAYRRPSLEDGGLSLLDWMSSYDKRGSLEAILSKFRDTLLKVNDDVAEKLGKEIPDALRLANEASQEHRVVQGLEKRLTQMSTYQSKAEARYRSQNELMTTLASNLERLERERDASVVGELCKQHRRVLITMADNHKKQTEAVEFTLKGKNDFMGNLHMRFAWITRIQMVIIHQENYFMMISKRMRELHLHRVILEQARSAAPLYAQALCEMVRRREFAQRYLSWANGVVDASLASYEAEVETRDRAVEKLDQHFLICLFRAMRRWPKKFASKPPVNADANLPALTQADIDELRLSVPELEPFLVIEPPRAFPPVPTGPLSSEERAVQTEAEETKEEEKVEEAEAKANAEAEAGKEAGAGVEAEVDKESKADKDAEADVEADKEAAAAVLRSDPVPVPPRPESEVRLGASCTGSPFVEMQRCAGDEDEVFSSALLNLEDNQRGQATQTDGPDPDLRVQKVQRAANAEIAVLRSQLVELRRNVTEEAAGAKQEAQKVAVAAAEMAAREEGWLREKQALEDRLASASSRIAALERDLASTSQAAEQRLARDLDLLRRNLLLEHEVALEGERGRAGSVRQELSAALREAERKAEWAEEKAAGFQKERGLLERAAEAEKKVYEAELLRMREELEAARAGSRSRRARRVSVSSDSQQHILEECPRMEDSDLDAGWVKKEKEDVIHEQDLERIAQLEETLAQRDGNIQELRITVDRLSQQVMRDREQIRQLRSGEPSTRPILGASPPQLSRSPPVLEQPAPISFLLMSPSSPARASPVTSPPKSAVASSSMTESAISSASTAVGLSPSSPAPGGPGRELESPLTSMMASGASASAFAAANTRGIKLVLSLFRSGDRVLLLRNPSTGLWFMLSTDGWSYFVHNDCFAILELNVDKFYMFAEFKSKERCLARKNKNRFSLPAGNYFFRIKARPLRSAPGELAMAARIGPEAKIEDEPE